MRSDRWAQSPVILGFLLIYFASGFSALLYQVIWQRMLAIFSGADVFAATTIVASFMTGLGAGSVCGGLLADKVGLRAQIGVFALAECLTGVLGIASKCWYYDVLYSRSVPMQKNTTLSKPMHCDRPVPSPAISIRTNTFSC
jgi:MFS family permease